MGMGTLGSGDREGSTDVSEDNVAILPATGLAVKENQPPNGDGQRGPVEQRHKDT